MWLYLIGAETGYKSEKTPRRLRLHQIRHLARLLNTSMGESRCTSQQIGENVIMKDGVTGTCKFSIVYSSAQFFQKHEIRLDITDIPI